MHRGITIEQAGTKLVVTCPYSKEFTDRARDLGGKYKGEGARVFDARDEDRVRALLVDVFGHDDQPPAATVTVHVNVDVYEGPYRVQTLWLAGRAIATRVSRDTPVRLGDGVTVVQGGFDRTGGSVKNPRLDAEPGTVLMVRDVPAQHRDVQAKGVTVVDRQGPTAEPAEPVRPVVLATALELVRIAQGNPMVLRTLDGTEVRVRLYTADELLAATADAVAEVGGAELTREDAERLAAPIPDQLG